MKRSLLALAVLGAFAGVASAQSSVTLYGTIDLNGRYVKNEGSNKRLSLSQDGINSSQLGFRGIEDLGGGLKASFILLAGVNADTGTTNAKFFNRRATASLSGGFGEVRLGRDYVPTFWNNTNFDAFGTNGLGDSSHVQQIGRVNGFYDDTFVRADNSIGYFLPPNLGGVYGQVMLAAGEGGLNGAGTTPGRYVGGRLGFAAGPFDIAAAAAKQEFVGSGASVKTYNIGGSYDFGFVKLLGYIDRDQASNDIRENRGSVSAVARLGQGEIHAGYSLSKLSGFGPSNKVNQYALGYVYNLSKRTALYSNVSYVTQDDASRNSVASSLSVNPTSNVTGQLSSQTAAPILGGHSKGAEFGIRHFF